MRPYSFTRPGYAACTAIALALWGLGTQPSVSADIGVYTSAAPAEVEKMLAAQFTEATGNRILFTIGTVREIQEALARSGTPDIVVLPAPALDAPQNVARFRPGSRIDLARVGIGVAVRDGAPLPDISTVDALRRTLLAARSIAHPDPLGGGFAGQQIARMFTRLGIAQVLEPRVKLAYAAVGGVAQVANGEAEIGLFNISEILPVKGVTLVGPLVPELQSYITFSAAQDVRGLAGEPAAGFLRSLSEAHAGGAWSTGGFELVGSAP